MATYHPPDIYSETLDIVEKKYLGVFSTELKCSCGENIMDHATKHGPDVPPSHPRDAHFGPSPDWQEQLQRFQVFHDYYCDSCGLEYRRTVIEGALRYQPLEKREPIPRSAQAIWELSPEMKAHVENFRNKNKES
jgi:hypothetical protein